MLVLHSYWGPGHGVYHHLLPLHCAASTREGFAAVTQASAVAEVTPMNQELMEVRDRVAQLLENQQAEQVQSLLTSLHPADLAELLNALTPEEQAALLGLLSDQLAAETIAELDPEEQAAILHNLSREQVRSILDKMSADDVADLVGELPPSQAKDLMQLLDLEDATDVRELLEFPPDTAGGIMTTEYIAVQAAISAQGAIEELRRLAPEAETPYYVYVVDEGEHLVGVLSLRELILAAPDRPVGEIMRSQVVSVGVLDDQEEVARTVRRYGLLAVPVVDAANRLRGIITVDDVIDVLEEEATEDLYRAGGLGEGETDQEAGVWAAVKARLPWLLGLLFLSLCTGKVIEHYNSLLTTATALSFFITTMAGGSGNAATQALTVVVRGLGTGEIERNQIWRVVWREIRIGLIIGAICGVVIGLTGYVLQGSLWISLIAALALFVNLTLAKAAGTLVPFLIASLGFDPAVASGPFIATITDTTSTLVYFSIASAVLHYAGVI